MFTLIRKERVYKLLKITALILIYSIVKVLEKTSGKNTFSKFEYIHPSPFPLSVR